MGSLMVLGAIVRCIENKQEVLLVKHQTWTEHDGDADRWGLPGGEEEDGVPYDLKHLSESILRAGLAYGVGWSVLYNLQCEDPFTAFHTSTFQHGSEICVEMFFRCSLRDDNAVVVIDDLKYSEYVWVELSEESLFEGKFPLTTHGGTRDALTCLLK